MMRGEGLSDIVSMPDFDVVVVGGGPSGGSTGYYLAAGGARVLILEKQKLPRPKLCSGLLTGYSQEAAEEILGPYLAGTVIGRACQSQVFDGSDRHLNFAHRPLKFVDRSLFDCAILTQAAEAGAEIEQQSSVQSVIGALGSIYVTYTSPVGERTIVTRHVVAADGAETKLGRQLQQASTEHTAVALEAKGVRWPELDGCWIDFSLPGGYYWAFPKADGTAGVGGGTFDASLWPSLKAQVLTYWHQHGIDLDRLPGHRLRFVLGPVARDGIFLVGEAAGALDICLAEGIRYALVTGRLAAEAILHSQDPCRTYRRRYALEVGQLLWRRRIGKSLFQGSKGMTSLAFAPARSVILKHVFG